MPPYLFWTFSALLLVFALLVILLRNPVSSAMSLVVSFAGLAALFVSLNAYFLGIIQILVYAGAVMVLFLFIIMLLDLKAEKARKINWVAMFGGGLVACIFAGLTLKVIGSMPAGAQAMPAMAEGVSDTREIGMTLFTDFNLQLQIIGALVLVATIGVIILSKKELK